MINPGFRWVGRSEEEAVRECIECGAIDQETAEERDGEEFIVCTNTDCETEEPA